MGALQDVVNCRLASRSPFAIRSGKRSKINPHGQRVERETANEEPELIDQAVAGDSVAQSRLFATHTPRLYRVAFNVLHNKEDAEDAVQDCWCKAYSKLQIFEGRSSLSTWLTRIVINSALMIRRRNKHQFLISLDEVSDDARGLQQCLVDERRTPEEAWGDEEVNGLLAQQIQQLPLPTRTAFLLRDLDELTTSESMERLGVNESALKSRVLRARRRIVQNMGQLLHADRQRNRFFITVDRRLANASSTVTSGAGEASRDRV